MPSNFNTTPTSTTSLGVNQFPVSAVFVPGTASGNTTALQGGPASTDANGYTSAPMTTYTSDGNDVAQGTTTDAVYSGSGAGTVIALLKKLVAELSATLAVSGTVTANAGTNLNTSALALESGGNLAGAKADLDTIVTNTTSLATHSDMSIANTHLANIDTDSASIVTNTSSTATSTSTVAGAVFGGKMQVSVASALPAGSNTIGAVTQASGPWTVQPEVGTTGGSTPYHNVVSSGTNGTNVKSTAGQVYDGSISNTSASAVYFRFYDDASAPTVGTTTVKRTIQVPGNGTVIFSWPNGLKFTSGVAWGITASIADNDTTAIGAAVSIDFGYV